MFQDKLLFINKLYKKYYNTEDITINMNNNKNLITVKLTETRQIMKTHYKRMST